MKSRIASVIAILLLAVATATAHHAAAGIDRTTTKELKGTIKAFSWQNPHSWMEVEVLTEGKVVVWTVEMTARRLVASSASYWSRTLAMSSLTA